VGNAKDETCRCQSGNLTPKNNQKKKEIPELNNFVQIIKRVAKQAIGERRKWLPMSLL
jgi:hypothetical protein